MHPSSTHLEVEWVVPLPEAVVEAHVEASRSHTVREVTNEVTLGSKVNAVPIPVVGVLEVAPSLVVL